MDKNSYSPTNPLYKLFYGEKTDWYTQDEKGYKTWDENKTTHFWETLRQEKMAKNDYDFSEFVFPEFIHVKATFWLTTEKREFPEAVNFRQASFSGEAYFSEASFSGKANFRYASFSGEAYFMNVYFSGEASFVSSSFSGEAYFSEASFSGEVDFRYASFSDKAGFVSSSFSGEVDFRYASFSGEAYFSEASFSGEANFWDASFSGKANFWDASFSGNGNFNDASFFGKANFRSASFFGGTSFWDVSFSGEVDFMDASFSGEADFSYASFSGGAYFSGASFSGEAYFSNASFSGNTYFTRTSFKGKLFFTAIYCVAEGFLHFYDTDFSEEHISSFKNLHLFTPTKPHTPRIRFEQVMCTEKMVFLNVAFDHIQFVDCELTHIKIGNCTFPKEDTNNRLLLSNECITETSLKDYKKSDEEDAARQTERLKEIEQQLAEQQDILKQQPSVTQKELDALQTKLEAVIKATKEIPEEKGEQALKLAHYKMMEVTYRQLKTNRIINKDWATAGDAYRSEMVMRRKAIWYKFIENPWRKCWLLINLLIVRIHGTFSGYQQSLSKPLLWLLVVWLGFALGYYFGYYEAMHNYTHPFQTSMKESFFAAFPLSGSLEVPKLKVAMSLERILSVILITFFVLATRARLKQ
ncbi:hypothetical protein NBRC110019_20910 [Neptunitalea chrysea]|uniref:Pentapeptide repeat-containing protein n=1 Tax=Neptunitalea chrysea TaxID=1647581 RepID=A0A9W6B5S7_9FLAO|nr:pentapeptide repeat-containing protein [Neptunitalea chrysea]GLB53051.1 hypothetical protein NBRC110019_20910 [Neptunitalea chrysea]